MLLGRVEPKILPDMAYDTPELFVDLQSSHIHNKILNYRREIDKSNVPKKVVHGTATHTLSHFNAISEEKLDKLMSRCKITKCNLNPIDYKKIDISPLKPYFLEIINSSFRTSIFPASEKVGDISPIIKDKSDDRNDPNKYRPITRASYTAKLVELETYDQLKELVELNNILPHNQSAYRSLHSTETALTKIYSDLIVSKDQSAAFDTVDHELLIADLFQLGLRSRALDYIRSFLTSRSYQVTANGCTSDKRPLIFGVPQGSVLGPLLFVIYTQSLAAELEALGVSYHMYADDTQIYFEFDHDKVHEVKLKLSLIVEKVLRWMLS